MSNTWGPWIQHDGKGCPCPAGTMVEVVSEDRFGFLQSKIGRTDGDGYSSWDWQHFPVLKKIIRYREQKPRALEMLQDIARTVEAPQTPSKVCEDT